jgi:acetylornithine deacetylase/succinyl-diaminopimelate desuccinylase-like protein
LTPQAIEAAGWPVVIGTSPGASPDASHVLIFGYSDVQPPGTLDAWTTSPFEPTVRDRRVYARGAGDNNGQHLAHLAALRA